MKLDKTTLLRVLALIGVIGISILVFSFRDKAEELAKFGYPGIFIVALMANATVLLPAPGLAIVFAMGSIFHPLGVALAAASGGAIGELSGYLAGFSGQGVIERADIYKRVEPLVQKYGSAAVMFLAAIPNPFFDLAGVAAGVMKMPIWRFLLFTWFGRLIKMSIFAYSGAFSINKALELFTK